MKNREANKVHFEITCLADTYLIVTLQNTEPVG